MVQAGKNSRHRRGGSRAASAPCQTAESEGLVDIAQAGKRTVNRLAGGVAVVRTVRDVAIPDEDGNLRDKLRPRSSAFCILYKH